MNKHMTPELQAIIDRAKARNAAAKQAKETRYTKRSELPKPTERPKAEIPTLTNEQARTWLCGYNGGNFSGD